MMNMTQTTTPRRRYNAPYLHFVDLDGCYRIVMPTSCKILQPEPTELGWEINLEVHFPNGEWEICPAFKIDRNVPDVEARLVRANAELRRRLTMLLGGPDSEGFFEQLDAIPAERSAA